MANDEQPRTAPKLRVAAIGDLHVQENDSAPYRELFNEISQNADVLVLCGDLTNFGKTTEAEILAEDIRSCSIPVIGVLGNHDYECGQPDKVSEILHDAGMTVLDEQAVEIEGVGFAGVKGFMGGYGRGELAPFGEPVAKAFVDEVMKEARKLENGLRSLRTDRSVAVLHYSPTEETLEGEPPAIYQYLGSARARLGWTPVDSLLVYGTAGLAWERVDQTTGFVQSVQAGTSGSWQQTAADKFGWVGGIGAEVMLGNQNWIGRLEYLHYGMGNVAQTLSIPPISQTSGSQNIDVIRAGLAYKFGGTQPWTNAYASAAVTAPSALWTGFYIGGHGGYGWGQNPYAVPFSSLIGGGIGILTGESMSGWLAGAQIGYNWQYGSVVTGVEFDLSAADIDGTSSTATVSPGPGSTATGTLEHHVKYLGTIRGRLGWTPLNNVLLYGTGGLAWERAHRTEIVTSTVTGGELVTTSRDHFGWAAGAGAEFMLGNSNWIGRIEYLHYDFGQVEPTFTFTSSTPGESSTENGGRQTINVVRAGVSYKFAP